MEIKPFVCLLFCDDKAKVSFGDPDVYVSIGVHGKQSIVPTNTTLRALDHDMTKATEIDVFQRHFRELFLALDLKKLQKMHMHKKFEYMNEEVH